MFVCVCDSISILYNSKQAAFSIPSERERKFLMEIAQLLIINVQPFFVLENFETMMEKDHTLAEIVCPRCGAPRSVLRSVRQLSDSVNQFGRRELTFQAESDEFLHIDPESKLWHCEKCGLDYPDAVYTGGKKHGEKD